MTLHREQDRATIQGNLVCITSYLFSRSRPLPRGVILIIHPKRWAVLSSDSFLWDHNHVSTFCSSFEPSPIPSCGHHLSMAPSRKMNPALRLRGWPTRFLTLFRVVGRWQKSDCPVVVMWGLKGQISTLGVRLRESHKGFTQPRPKYSGVPLKAVAVQSIFADVRPRRSRAFIAVLNYAHSHGEERAKGRWGGHFWNSSFCDCNW